jgi:hypothetical protein
MTLPTFLFALLIALFYGAFYHLVRGGNGWRLLLYFGLSILGFMAGQWIGAMRQWSLIFLGSFDLGMGTIGSIIFLIGGEWLSQIESKRESKV